MFEVVVVFEGLFYRACLEVVAAHDLVCHHFAEVILLAVHLAVEVVSKFLFEGFKFWFGVFVVAFKFGNLLEVCQALFALAVVLEVAVLDHLLEVGIVGIGDGEVFHGWDGGMALTVFGAPIGQDIVVGEVIDDVGEGVVLHFDVGFDAVAFGHFTTSCRVEYPFDAVCLCVHFLACGAVDFSCFTQFLVVNLLDATSGGQVILGCGEFDAAIVGKFAGTLHQTFAVGVATDDDSAVEVLKGARHDFCRTGCLVVNEHSERNVEVERVVAGGVGVVGCHHLAFGLHNLQVLGCEEVDDVDGFIEQTTTIAAKVEDDFLGSFLFQGDDGFAHIFGTAFGELSQEDVSGIAHQALIGDGGDFDASACNLEVACLLFSWTLNTKHEGGAGFATQQVTHFCGVHAFQVFVVNLQQHIAHLQTHFGSRHVNVGLLNDDGGVFPHADDGTDAAIFACGHHLQLSHVFLGIELGVDVQIVGHGIDADADDLLSFQ